MCTILIQLISGCICYNIDTQIVPSEQGTVSVETNRCNQNLVSFIVRPWFICVQF